VSANSASSTILNTTLANRFMANPCNRSAAIIVTAPHAA
jgi:hypothetical protein